MIRLDRVSVTYPAAPAPALRDVTVAVPEGELALVVGPTGAGKSTLLKTLNGLVPHFTGGTLTGSVTVAGRSTRDFPPRELADVVGYVQQDPQQGFVTDVVEEELAYTMESLGVPPAVMRRRVEETLDLLGIAALRGRALRSLSGGERQRVSIGAVLTAHPRVLVLDEPTSALDPQAAEEVLSAISRLVQDLALTVVMSEHRLERVVQFADRVLVVDVGGSVRQYDEPAQAMAESPVYPPVVALGRWAGWQPLPLSVRDARRRAEPLRRALGAPEAAAPAGAAEASPGQDRTQLRAELHGCSYGYGPVPALTDVRLRVGAGEVVALMGRNGAGKSTALALLSGQLRPAAGTVTVGGADPSALRGAELLGHVALVPQEPQDLLWAESVGGECAAADRDAGAAPGSTAHLLHQLHGGIDPRAHPNDLSEGTRLALVLAVMLVADPPLLLLDEPTRGLDYAAKRRLTELIRERAGRGRAIVLATHDVELVAECCTRLVLLADGEAVLDTDARSGSVSSPTFAPQVAKILAPAPVLTVAELRDLLPAGAAP